MILNRCKLLEETEVFRGYVNRNRGDQSYKCGHYEGCHYRGNHGMILYRQFQQPQWEFPKPIEEMVELAEFVEAMATTGTTEAKTLAIVVMTLTKATRALKAALKTVTILAATMPAWSPYLTCMTVLEATNAKWQLRCIVAAQECGIAATPILLQSLAAISTNAKLLFYSCVTNALQPEERRAIEA